MTDIFKFLSENNVEFERHDHPPVYTVDDVHRLVPPLPAAKTKNLFFRDQKGKRHFLVIVEGDKRLDIKALPSVFDSGKVSFASARRLEKHLGVEPGSVTILALVNDRQKKVEVFVDKALWESDAFQFHPLVNTSTLVIGRENLKRFLEATGHEVNIVDVPGQT